MKFKFVMPCYMFVCATLILVACDKSNAKSNSDMKSSQVSITQPQSDAHEIKVATTLAPEDDKKLVGTQVLGFKLRHSTFNSVKSRLMDYKFDDTQTSFAGGYILQNDGSGFGIEGLIGTEFAFDSQDKLVYVGMVLQESDSMNHATYKKIVSYISKNGYKIVQKVEPFVGDREIIFKTPKKETVVVSAPHLGGFRVYVEYYTDEFGVQRQMAIKNQQKSQTDHESSNF